MKCKYNINIISGFYFLNLPTVNESTAHLKKTLYYIFAIYNNVCHGQKPAVKSEYVTVVFVLCLQHVTTI